MRHITNGVRPDRNRPVNAIRQWAFTLIEVLFAGMRAPQNWGPEYAKAFDSIFPELAAKHGVSLYPFFLDGVALDPALVMQDGLHPTEKGVAEIVRRILPFAETMVRKIQEGKTAANK